jgi:methionine synthase II (cobalamin-independent)
MVGSTHIAEGSYEPIAEKLFTKLNCDTFYLEYDTVRAGGFEPLRFLPRGKNAVLGLVSTKSPDLERKEEVEARILAAAGVIATAQGVTVHEALDCLAVSPQCGFSSMSVGGGIGVTEDIMWKKLELCREVTSEIWGK